MSAGKKCQDVTYLVMRIMISADMEGATGVTWNDDVQPGTEQWQRFRVMFTGDVKRLYDTARSLQGNRRLDLVFTSMVPWVAEKPWEFAFDPGRNTFLATEEIHFVRNVLTQVPGDPCIAAPGPLRILVVSAQPPGTVELSIDQETQMIQRDFSTLVNAGLAQVDVLPRATISDLLL